MKGIELAERFFEEYGRPMLEEDFRDLLPYVAAGLFGSGSEALGYDDDISQDHDFEPAFCLLLPGEDVVGRRSAFLLERAYAKLPKEFMGFRRSVILPVGGARHGVLRTEEVFMEKTGTKDGKLSIMQWLRIPEQALLEAVNGKIFYDGYGEVSEIRNRLAYYPEDIRRKKLAGQFLLMAQSGQYNYMRCAARDEGAAAQMAVFEFVKSTMAAAFLLNRRYQPYYKWGFRALRELKSGDYLAEELESLITTGNDAASAKEKSEKIEYIAEIMIVEAKTQGLTEVPGNDLERHAYAINNTVTDAQIRNMHILEGV